MNSNFENCLINAFLILFIKQFSSPATHLSCKPVHETGGRLSGALGSLDSMYCNRCDAIINDFGFQHSAVTSMQSIPPSLCAFIPRPIRSKLRYKCQKTKSRSRNKILTSIIFFNLFLNHNLLFFF